MKDIWFLLDDRSLGHVDLAHPDLGNPGIGGTEYCFAALAHELATRRLIRSTVVHCRESVVLSAAVRSVVGADLADALRIAATREARPHVVVLRGDDSLPSSRILEWLPEGVPVLAWAHNHLRPSTLTWLARERRIRRVIYVGREQWALAADSPCYEKSTYIVNGFHALDSGPPGPRPPVAAYIGSLVPAKGFHRVARLWRSIHRQVPEASLEVIGSARVYENGQALGPAGIAEPSYERKFLKILGSNPGKFNVRFHGKMGLDKFRLLRHVRLGLANPTGFTECCPGSILETSACGAAVVAPRRWGACDTVLDLRTGVLCDSEQEYLAAALDLLRNPEKAAALGAEGPRWVASQFDFDLVSRQWMREFALAVDKHREAPTCRPRLAGQYFSSPLRELSPVGAHMLHRAANAVDHAHGWLLSKL